MPDYWIKCPLDVKEKIQQYLIYNMIKELQTAWDEIYLNINGRCNKCNIILQENNYNITKIKWKKRKPICDECFIIKYGTRCKICCINAPENYPMEYCLLCQDKLNISSNNDIKILVKLYARLEYYDEHLIKYTNKFEYINYITNRRASILNRINDIKKNVTNRTRKA